MTLPNCCPLMNLLAHLGFNVDNMRTYDINLVIYKDSKDSMMISMSGSDMNYLFWFYERLKLPNKHMCDICSNEHKCFRPCGKCKISCALGVSRTIKRLC